jgi:5-methylcytosine-specific restriction endonuclease McrA
MADPRWTFEPAVGPSVGVDRKPEDRVWTPPARDGVGIGYASEPRCEHPREELRRFVASNGVSHFRVQCLGCGDQIRSIRKGDLPCSPDELPSWDEAIRERYWRTRHERQQREIESARSRQSAEWWRWYNAYLESPEWAKRRALVLRRALGKCEAILSSRCWGSANQVHHLTYEHVGNEPLFELVAICEACHEGITEMDRSRRG